METTLDQNFWNNRWISGQTGWDIGYASPAITDYFSRVENKNAKILIPGCGNAYEAQALFDMGFTDITILDISDEAVKKLEQKFEHHDEIQVLNQDFFEHNGNYDFIVEQTFFCALDPALRPDYAPKMHSLLNQDGMLTGLLFDREFEHSGPPFGGNKEEYETLFKPYFSISQIETAGNSIPQRQGTELFIELIKK